VPREAPGWSTLLSIGSVFVVLIAGGLALGWFVDGLLHTYPVVAVIGLALGIAGGIYYSIVQFRSFMNQ
jgi:F0F1-type ATP synthase assembly protein I